jgi:hypothetical protein
MCSTCLSVEREPSFYGCKRHDLKVKLSDLCDDYQPDGEFRVC